MFKKVPMKYFIFRKIKRLRVMLFTLLTVFKYFVIERGIINSELVFHSE
jgi:hypothetical protein